MTHSWGSSGVLVEKGIWVEIKASQAKVDRVEEALSFASRTDPSHPTRPSSRPEATRSTSSSVGEAASGPVEVCAAGW